MTAVDAEAERRELDSLARDLDEFFQAEPSPRPVDPSCPPQLPDSDYRLVRLIGSGGMGAVWEAEQVSLGRRVAVKVLCVAPADLPAWRDRFVRESRIVAQLHHPGVVKVFAAGACGETFWYAMELVEGVPLSRYAFPDLRTAVEGIRMAAAALGYAHGCGVVHRDVKPANLLVDAQGRLLVADFGLAADTSDGPDDGGRDGTRRYMAPERLEKGVCGPAADQYALALTLREIAATFPKAPFHADLARVLDKALARDPANRYADMAAFSDDLRRVLAYEPLSAHPVSWFHHGVLWCRRHPRAAVAAVLALLCGAGFVGALCSAYVRTEHARRQAAQNAHVADGALSRVFRHVSQQTPSPGDPELLSALRPYFGQLAGADIVADRAQEALSALGICAFRGGDYALAERSFRELIGGRRHAADLNWLAETVRRQGHEEEAQVLARRVAETYAASPDAAERFQAAVAYESLAARRPRENADRAAAFALYCALLRNEPGNAEYRLHALNLLAGNPALGKGTDLPSTRRDVLAELGRLADAHPEKLDYGLAVVQQVTRLLKRLWELKPEDARLVRETRLRADALLGRFFSRDCVVSAVLEYRHLYASWLVAQGLADEARRERVRTETMIELLVGAADLPMPKRGAHAYPGGSLPYRRLDLAGEGEPVLVVLLHARNRNGGDNTLQLSTPLLRPLVQYAKRRGLRVSVLLPQCPQERPQAWFGTSREQPDGLLDGVAGLVAETARELRVPAARVRIAGELEGADAALALAARHPEALGRVLAVGAQAVPAGEAARIRATVRICQAEFDWRTPVAEMEKSLEAFPETGAARPELSVLKGLYRTTVPDGAATDVNFGWFFAK